LLRLHLALMPERLAVQPFSGQRCAQGCLDRAFLDGLAK
jgi:hypothetical protein